MYTDICDMVDKWKQDYTFMPPTLGHFTRLWSAISAFIIQNGRMNVVHTSLKKKEVEFDVSLK